MKNGLIIINKSEGLSSQGVVTRVKKLLGVKKAGHTGTLDPLATGVLPVLIERGVKASEYMITSDKHYRATLLLGITTDTEDVTGTVLTQDERVPSEDEALSVIRSFVGEYMQTPPMYSALKVGGKKLCDLARSGKEIEREPRRVEIFDIKAEKKSEMEYSLDVHCSKGTYIRTLCADIGKALGVGGVMKTLCRTKASGFTLEDAITLEELMQLDEAEVEKRVLPIERVFEKYEKITLSDFYSRLAKNGVEIYLKKIGNPVLEYGSCVRLYDSSDEFFALGEVREFEDGAAIKPIKQF